VILLSSSIVLLALCIDGFGFANKPIKFVNLFFFGNGKPSRFRLYTSMPNNINEILQMLEGKRGVKGSAARDAIWKPCIQHSSIFRSEAVGCRSKCEC